MFENFRMEIDFEYVEERNDMVFTSLVDTYGNLLKLKVGEDIAEKYIIALVDRLDRSVIATEKIKIMYDAIRMLERYNIIYNAI